MDTPECVGSDTNEKEVTKRPTTLHPLQPDTYGTGRWTYKGKNLAPEEVEALTAKGVDWEKDLMPDGRLKHPRFRFHGKARRQKKFTFTDLRARDAERRIRYDALPEPKPDYFEWAALETRKDQFSQLEQDAFCANRPSDRLKALGTLLEFSKSKPKQTVAVEESRTTDVEWTPKKILEYALELNGIGLTAEQFKSIAEQQKV